MTAALAFALLVRRDQASDLLDQAVVQPADVIRSQITTQGRYLPDAYEFVDEFKTDTMGKRKSGLSALEQLISRGSEVIPYLVSQLGSTEATKLKMEPSGDVQVVAYEAYDPRVRQPETDYWDVVTMEDVQKAQPYTHTITRGDLAYFALGQITNRWYGILFPGKITLFCSASDHPAIQKQASEDWGKTTDSQLNASLREDVRKPDTYARMTYGFTRFRSYFPGDAVELAVETLRNTYGRWPKGKPDPSPRTFVSELQPVGDSAIDQILYRWITQTDKQNGFLKEYELAKYDAILYLKDRRGYGDIAMKYAKEIIQKKQDKYGYYARFVKNYGPRK